MLVSAEQVDETKLSDALHSTMEQVWEVQQPARINLIPLWASISWATIEDEVLSPLANGRTSPAI
jgi:hypothetical protein